MQLKVERFYLPEMETAREYVQVYYSSYITFQDKRTKSTYREFIFLIPVANLPALLAEFPHASLRPADDAALMVRDSEDTFDREQLERYECILHDRELPADVESEYGTATDIIHEHYVYGGHVDCGCMVVGAAKCVEEIKSDSYMLDFAIGAASEAKYC